MVSIMNMVIIDKHGEIMGYISSENISLISSLTIRGFKVLNYIQCPCCDGTGITIKGRENDN